MHWMNKTCSFFKNIFLNIPSHESIFQRKDACMTKTYSSIENSFYKSQVMKAFLERKNLDDMDG
jgi:hypothetical protein